MTKTEKLFYKDPYQTNFIATVIDISTKGVVLDKTTFYPQGGYQESDGGFLKVDDDSINIVKVVDEGGVVYHQLESGHKISVDDRVEGAIDWEKRWYLSILHSTQHILSRIVFNRYKIHTVRSDFSINGGIVIFSTNFKNEWLDEVEEEFHKIVEAEMSVERLISEEDINIKVGDFDNTPCGGTHVANTRDLSTAFLIGTDKGKLLFDGGERGVKRLRDRGRKLFRVQKMFNFPQDIVDTVEKTIDNYNTMSSSLENYRRDFLLKAFKDDQLPQLIKDIKVSVIINDDLDSKVIKKTLKMKAVTYSADLYIICLGEKLIVLTTSEKVNAQELCDPVINTNTFITGGGNRKRVDMSVENVDVAVVVDMIISELSK